MVRGVHISSAQERVMQSAQFPHCPPWYGFLCLWPRNDRPHFKFLFYCLGQACQVVVVARGTADEARAHCGGRKRIRTRYEGPVKL